MKWFRIDETVDVWVLNYKTPAFYQTHFDPDFRRLSDCIRESDRFESCSMITNCWWFDRLQLLNWFKFSIHFQNFKVSLPLARGRQNASRAWNLNTDFWNWGLTSKISYRISISVAQGSTIISRLVPKKNFQFYFSNVPSASNWNRLVLIKNEISARNQWNPRRTDGETVWAFWGVENRCVTIFLGKILTKISIRKWFSSEFLLPSPARCASEIAECWSTHHLEWFHIWKFIQSLIFGPIISERSTPYFSW